MKKLFILIIYLVSSEHLHAQKSLELGLGSGHLMSQDITVSPMVHEAFAPINARLAFQWHKRNENTVEVRFGQYKTAMSEQYSYISEFNDEEELANRHTFTRFELNYSYFVNMHQHEKYRWSLGAVSRNRLIAGLHDFAVFDEQFSYNFSFGIDLAASMVRNINEKNTISTQINLPLFAFSARNPYLSQDSKWMKDNMKGKALNSLFNMIGNATLRSWGSYRTFDLSLAWTHELNDNWSLGSRYMFCGIRNTKPTKYTSFENVLQFTIKKSL